MYDKIEMIGDREIDAIMIEAATTSDPLAEICARNGTTRQKWYYRLVREPGLMRRFHEARLRRAEVYVDEIIDILAQEPAREDRGKRGIGPVDRGWVEWRRQQIEARKWMISKLLPARFGDRLEIEHKIEKVILPANPKLELVEKKELKPDWGEESHG